MFAASVADEKVLLHERQLRFGQPAKSIEFQLVLCSVKVQVHLLAPYEQAVPPRQFLLKISSDFYLSRRPVSFLAPQSAPWRGTSAAGTGCKLSPYRRKSAPGTVPEHRTGSEFRGLVPKRCSGPSGRFPAFG